MNIGFDQQVQKAIDHPDTMREAIKEGLDINWFSQLAQLFGIPGTRFATIVGMDPRTLSRRRREGKLTPREANALYHLAVLYLHALDVLGDSETMRNWFTSPEPYVPDMLPIELLYNSAGL